MESIIKALKSYADTLEDVAYDLENLENNDDIGIEILRLENILFHLNEKCNLLKQMED